MTLLALGIEEEKDRFFLSGHLLQSERITAGSDNIQRCQGLVYGLECQAFGLGLVPRCGLPLGDERA